MRHGDLSNEAPRRILVALPYVMLPPEAGIANRLRRRRRNYADVAAQYTPLPATVSHLLHISTKFGVLMELFAIGVAPAELDAVLERLDAGPGHPFTHHATYPLPHEFISTLPYRPEVVGVVDLPERGLMYGSWFMSLDGL